MRLTASRLSKLTPEILHDLSKLSLPVATSDISAWLEQANQVWLATFNNKVIALGVLNQSGEEYTLDHLSVREVTRRRGVGGFLLEEMSKALPESAELIEAQSEQLKGDELKEWQAFLLASDWLQDEQGKWCRG